jgi:hypothetical protein
MALDEGATGVCGGARPSRSIEEETYACRSSLTHRCLFRRRERAGNGSPSAVLHRAYCRARRGLNLQGLGRYQAMEGGDKEEVSAHSRASRSRSKGRRDHRHHSAYREAIRRPCAIPFDPATFAGRGQQSHFRRHSKYLTQSTWSHSTLYVGRYSSGEYWAQVS